MTIHPNLIALLAGVFDPLRTSPETEDLRRFSEVAKIHLSAMGKYPA
jgi:hypothetical protein